ncbi:FxsA family protein [Desulfohalovibrio reitneri]|uniref:FxsA family protein n=1 Tax=Desulfohalovibrio reitneri TaxID=1307759 RepID=UPI0004A6CB1C|nr:FxsA family protein [Desulfohalovibrio reitneri]
MSLGVRLFLLFTLVPLVEIFLFVKVGERIGGLNTVVLVIITAAVGAALARAQGAEAMRRIRRAMERGLAPAEELLDGALILVAGVVLLTPGFFTDLVGLFLLVPQGREVIKKRLRVWIKRKMDQGTIHIHRGP